MGSPVNSPDLLPTRRTLLSRLRDWGDGAGWEEFFNTYWRLIYQVALKAGLNEVEAQEVVQETLISVAKEMPGFRYDPARGKFKGWLLLLTRRRIADAVRKQRRADGATGKTPCERLGPELLEVVPEPGGALEQVWNQEWDRHLLSNAVANLKKRIRPEQYQLFDLYVVQQWPLRKITATLGVSAGRVYLAKHRVSALLKKEIRELEAQ